MARNFTFVKNVTGTLVITLNSYDMMLQPKNFTINHGVDRITVPYAYALGLFVTPEAKQQYDLGYFKILEEKEFFQAGMEESLISSKETNKDTFGKEEITKALKSNDAKAIKKMLDTKSIPVMINIVTIANEHYSQLTTEVIRIIEDACGVELAVE